MALKLFFFILLFALCKFADAIYVANETFSKNLMNGILKSPNFPNNYPNELNYKYEIEPLKNFVVIFNIEHFSTELFYDHVEIYTLYNWKGKSNYTVHRILSGSNLDENVLFSQVSGGFYISFETDPSETSSGFRFSYQRFNPSNGQFNHLKPCPNIRLEAKTTPKHLPLISTEMSSKSSCVFEIDSDAFVHFELKEISPSVRLQIYDSQKYVHFNTTSTILTNKSRLPFSLTTKVNPVTVVVSVISDQMPNSVPYQLVFKQANNPCVCPPQHINVTDEYFFQSPGYPFNYCHRLRCFTTFYLNLEHMSNSSRDVLQIRFDDFKVEAVHDLFEIHEAGKKLKVLTPFDEQQASMIKTFTLSSPIFSINFTTDDTISEKGFDLKITHFYVLPACSCPNQHFEFANQTGNVTYNFACNAMDCFYTIMPPKTTTPATLMLTMEFKLEKSTDFIEIFNDQDTQLNLNTVRLLSSMVPNNGLGKRTIQFDNQQPIRIWYHADDNELKRHNGKNMLSFHYKWTTECTCGDLNLVASSEWNRLFEFDFSGQDCHLLVCNYTISAPEGQTIELANLTLLDSQLAKNFTFFDRITSSEWAQIDFASNENGVVHSSSNSMVVQFSGNLSEIENAFNLVYKVSKLGKKAESQSSVPTIVFAVLMISVVLIAIVLAGLYAAHSLWRRRTRYSNIQLNNRYATQRFSSLASQSSAETGPM